MTVRYAVTFEFETLPPLTHRGTVSASEAATCFARAVREAQRALRASHWSSISVVLLERVQPSTSADPKQLSRSGESPCGQDRDD